MISHAIGLSISGSLKGTAMSFIFSIKPPPCSCDGIPPCTQNIYKKWINLFIYNFYVLSQVSTEFKTKEVCSISSYFIINGRSYWHGIKAFVYSFPDLFTYRVTKLVNTFSAKYVYHWRHVLFLKFECGSL